MQWQKKGVIFNTDGTQNWSKTHAQVPVVDCVSDKLWRVYYSTRNAANQSCTSFIDVEAGNPGNILYKHPKPILEKGPLGTFDDSGVMPTCIVNHKGVKYLYYIGWMVRASVPYHNALGIAVSENGTDFKRLFNGPVITTIHTEPYFTGTAYIMIDEGLWRMWYLSCTKWEIVNNKPEPFYHIKYAESTDGIIWKRDGIVAIDYRNDEEAGLVSAAVVKENGIYKMWFGYRGAKDYRTGFTQSYRIGYAESKDGIKWQRADEKAGIDVSPSGWDSQMISYPYIVSHHNKMFMFYNGNAFGQTGFGYATNY